MSYDIKDKDKVIKEWKSAQIEYWKDRLPYPLAFFEHENKKDYGLQVEIEVWVVRGCIIRGYLEFENEDRHINYAI